MTNERDKIVKKLTRCLEVGTMPTRKDIEDALAQIERNQPELERGPQASDRRLIKAVAGWRQCVSILEAVTESFDFAVAELRANKFVWGEEKKIAFLKADSRLRLAKQYTEAQNKSLGA